MLTALTIVIVLGLLAFGSFSEMKAKATAAGCINNIRQIHVAFMSYAGDNGNRLPLAEDKANSSAAWSWYLIQGNYLRQRESGARDHPLFDPGSLVRGASLTAGNYGVNRSLVGPAPTNTPNPQRLNMAAVTGHTQRLLLMCAGAYAVTRPQVASSGQPNLYLPGLAQNRSVSWQPAYEADATQGRHRGKVNALFLAGNVESLSPEELVARTDIWERR